jgi:hypothetical protein
MLPVGTARPVDVSGTSEQLRNSERDQAYRPISGQVAEQMHFAQEQQRADHNQENAQEYPGVSRLMASHLLLLLRKFSSEV